MMPYFWTKNYPDDVDFKSDIQMKLIHQCLQESTGKFPEHNFINFLGKKYTYAQAQEIVDKLAAGLQALGVKKGIHVGLFLPNTPAYVFFFFAIIKAGGTVVNFNVLNAQEEILQQAKDSDIAFIVTHDLKMLTDKVIPLLDKVALRKIIICSLTHYLTVFKALLLPLMKRSIFAKIPNDPRIIWDKTLLKDAADFVQPEISINDVAVLQYTGGTTGSSKGAMLTHGNLTANADMAFRLATKIDLNGKEIYLAVLPFFHIFGLLAGLLMQVQAGSSMILTFPRFEVNKAIKLIKKQKVTLLLGVPTMYAALARHPKARTALKSVKACISGGDTLPLVTKQAFEAVSGGVVVEGYGLTETSPMVSCNPQSGLNKEKSVGLPAPGCEVRLLDITDHKKFVGIGEKGEICVKGPHVMKGYYKHPIDTKKVMVDGFLRTGDIGYMDEDGYLYIVDREKDLIIVSGYNVYPRHVQDAIYKNPAIEETTVIGVPDAYQQQHVKAFIVLRKGYKVSKEEILEFLKDKLSPHEIPKEIEFRKELPKTLIGKLSKKELVEEELKKRK